MTQLSASGVGFRSVLSDISFDWSEGEMVGIVGPNGAGKSTLLRIVAGIWPASSGDIELNGINLKGMPSQLRAKEIAYLPQQISDQIPYTVLEYVEMGRYVYRNSWGGLDKESKRMVHEAIHKTNLAAYVHTPLADLSGGEKQRASIARCLAQGSKIILLDEPIASLDLFYQMEILKQLKEFAQSGYLIVLVLHNLELAAQYCSRLLIMKEGRIYGDGSPQIMLTEEAMKDVFQIQTKLYEDPFSGYIRLSHV
jgi:iron complex transport system ATP-binding protein